MKCPIFENSGHPQSVVESHWPDNCTNLHSISHENQRCRRNEGDTARVQGKQELSARQEVIVVRQQILNDLAQRRRTKLIELSSIDRIIEH